jgi:hypothetical protein
MEATPIQIVGCVFSLDPAPERIDDFATQARRERAVVTARSSRQATFVKFGATDARLIALACRAVQGAASLRFGFACSSGDRAAQAGDGVRVSARSLAQAGDLAAAARDGEVLLTPQLASLLSTMGFECRTKEVRLAAGRSAVACSLDAAATADERAGADDRPAASPGDERASDDTWRALTARADAMQRRQDDLEARQQAVLDQVTRATAQLEQLAAQAATLSQTLHESRHAVAALEERLCRSQAEREIALQHESDVAAFRAKVESLLGRVEETDGKIALIESRRKLVESVHARAAGITHMLDDIDLNLEMLGEQRAVIDEVGEKLARLDFTVREAHNTLRTLQRERELAERIEQSIKALRAGSATKVGAGS